MEAIREVGTFAGLAAFLGLAVLALLYFAQARDVRRLRENAEFLVEGPEGQTAPPQVPPPIGAEEDATEVEPEAALPPTDAEAFRRSELARQAADRRQRFEQRKRTGDGGRMPEFSSTAVVVIGALILIAGIGFGATRLLGGDEGGDGGGAGGSKSALACKPSQTQVAVLNGTAEAGLAAGYVPQLEQKGYEVRPVANTESAFDTSAIMFDANSQACAAEVQAAAGIGGISGTQPMDPEIQGIAEGAQVAVVLGEDQVTGGSGAATAPSSGTLGD